MSVTSVCCMVKKIASKDDVTGLFIPAGLCLGLGVGFAVGHLVAGLFIGLGLGFTGMAVVKNFKSKK